MGAGLEASYLACWCRTRASRGWWMRGGLSQASAEAEQSRQELIRSLDCRPGRRLIALEGKRGADPRPRPASRGPATSSWRVPATPWAGCSGSISSCWWPGRQLTSTRVQANEADLRQKAADLEQGLAAGSRPPPCAIRRRRPSSCCGSGWRTWSAATRASSRVDSDLAPRRGPGRPRRRECRLRGGGAAVTANLELASQTLDDGFEFGRVGSRP